MAQFSAQFSDALRFAPQALFTRFVDLPWEYRKLTAEEQTTTADGKWWKKVPKMTKGSLPTKWARELACIAAFCGRELAQCRVVNDEAIGRMAVPDDYLASLPKNAGDVSGKGAMDGMSKALKKDKLDPFALLAAEGVDRSDKIALMEAMNNLEKMALIWEGKMEAKGKKGGGGKKDMGTINARKVVSAIKSAYPGMGQTALEQTKMQQNRDVGSSVLEAYSRVLESRLSVLKDMALEVLAADGKADAPAPPPSEIEKWLESVREDVQFLSLAEAEASEHHGAEGTAADAVARLAEKKAGDEVAEAMAVVTALLNGCSAAATNKQRLDGAAWQARKREHDELVAAGHKTNNAGAPSGAMVSFEAACAKFPKTSTLISAVNMRLKLGEPERLRCAAAYTALATMKLADAEAALVQKKLGQITGEMKDEQVKALQAAVDDGACQRFERLAAEAVDVLRAVEERARVQQETERLKLQAAEAQRSVAEQAKAAEAAAEEARKAKAAAEAETGRLRREAELEKEKMKAEMEAAEAAKARMATEVERLRQQREAPPAAPPPAAPAAPPKGGGVAAAAARFSAARRPIVILSFTITPSESFGISRIESAISASVTSTSFESPMANGWASGC